MVQSINAFVKRKQISKRIHTIFFGMDRDYEIETIQESDIKELIEQNCAIFPHLGKYINDDLKSNDPDCTYFVLKHKGRPVGNIGLTKFGKDYEIIGMNAEDWVLGYFQIQPLHRGKGFGTLLMNKVEELARSKGIDKLWIDTTDRPQEAVAYKLYTKFGYAFNSSHSLPDFDYVIHILVKELK